MLIREIAKEEFEKPAASYQELELQLTTENKNIMKLLEIVEDEENYYLISEFCKYGHLGYLIDIKKNAQGGRSVGAFESNQQRT